MSELGNTNHIDRALKHFGVKGMKWGVRRSGGAGRKASASPTASADAARASATIKSIKKGGTKAVSDNDLQHLVKRLQLEKQLSEVEKTVPKKLDSKIKNLLGYGETYAKALQFANSDAGRELSQMVRTKGVGRYAKGTGSRVAI